MDQLTKLGQEVIDLIPDKASPIEIYDANQECQSNS